MPKLPTPQEIKQKTAEIRKTWSAKEKHKRRGGGRKRISVKVIDTSAFVLPLTENGGRGLAGWQYLTKGELKQSNSKKHSKTQADEPETFETSFVTFGE